MNRLLLASAATALLVLCGAAQGAPTTDEPTAQAFYVFDAAQPAQAPKVRTAVAALVDHVCRRPWDAAATEQEALASLQIQARRLGANGLVNVSFDRTRVDQKAPCWQRLTARGTAVVFDTAAQP